MGALRFYRKCKPRCRVLCTWASLLILILLSILFFFTKEEDKAYSHLKNDITNIAEIKIQQFVDWHNDRLADLKMFSQSPFFRVQYRLGCKIDPIVV
jgi:predicted AlkP superfamily phosphohydrolase/phosphomutase